jgi:hypothetical protein
VCCLELLPPLQKPPLGGAYLPSGTSIWNLVTFFGMAVFVLESLSALALVGGLALAAALLFLCISRHFF